MSVFETMARLRVVPVLSADDADTAEQACLALARGGLPVAEITFRTEAAADAIARVAAIDGFLVGAGTVLSIEQASAASEAGAAFAVAPGTNDEVVRECAALGLPFIPGAATASEIDAARRLGCDVVKIFPADALGGPAFLRSVSAVFRGMRFLPTGGVTADTLADYLAVPSVLACGGSWLVRPDLRRSGSFAEVERLTRQIVELP